MHLAILAVMVVLGILFVLPFIWMVIVTFEGQANIIPPVPPKYYIENPSLFNLKIVTENGQLLTSYINSFFVAVCSVALNLFSVLMGGYALSKGRFRGKGVILMVILSTMMIPFETRMIPMVHHVQCRGGHQHLLAHHPAHRGRRLWRAHGSAVL